MVGIKGWEMPERCGECRLRGYIEEIKGDGYSYCSPLGISQVLDYREIHDGVRPDFCPLVEAPE